MKDCLMSLKIRKNKSPIIITLLLILALLTGLTAGYFSTHGMQRRNVSLSQKTENSKPFPEKFFKMKFPAAPLPSIIPWHIRKNRVSGEKKLLSALSPQI